MKNIEEEYFFINSNNPDIKKIYGRNGYAVKYEKINREWIAIEVDASLYKQRNRRIFLNLNKNSRNISKEVKDSWKNFRDLNEELFIKS